MSEGRKIIAENRKARFDYAVEDSLECGVVLQGTEVKSVKEQIEVIKEQILMSVEWIDEVRGLLHMRRHMAAMFKGLPHFRDLRIRMLQAPNIEVLWEVFNEIEKRYQSGE